MPESRVDKRAKNSINIARLDFIKPTNSRTIGSILLKNKFDY